MRTDDGPPADDGRPGVDEPHFDCAEWMQQEFATLTGVPVTVTEVPPAGGRPRPVAGRLYAVTCEHGITLYIEPKDRHEPTQSAAEH